MTPVHPTPAPGTVADAKEDIARVVEPVTDGTSTLDELQAGGFVAVHTADEIAAGKTEEVT